MIDSAESYMYTLSLTKRKRFSWIFFRCVSGHRLQLGVKTITYKIKQYNNWADLKAQTRLFCPHPSSEAVDSNHIRCSKKNTYGLSKLRNAGMHSIHDHEATAMVSVATSFLKLRLSGQQHCAPGHKQKSNLKHIIKKFTNTQ